MRQKTKGKKTEAASSKALLEKVTKEMAKPHIAGSAHLTADQQNKKRRRNPASDRTREKAKPHVEEYGTGTPEETS